MRIATIQQQHAIFTKFCSLTILSFECFHLFTQRDVHSTTVKESLKPRLELGTQTHDALRPACRTSSGCWVGGHPHWSQKYGRTVTNSGHWLVQFKLCIITTAWRQRNSKHFLIWWLINFLQIYFIFARIFARFSVNFKSSLRKKLRKNRLKEGSRR
jgi:hypothetical protein